jgi:large subunit ribosomal protein L18
MSNQLIKKNTIRLKRGMRVRKHIHGTLSRPRLCVVKTNKHILAQLIDDDAHATIAMTSTYAKEFRNTEFGHKNKASAKKLGEHIASIAKEKNIKEVVFDRGPFKYHGILAELANAVREAGIQF